MQIRADNFSLINLPVFLTAYLIECSRRPMGKPKIAELSWDCESPIFFSSLRATSYSTKTIWYEILHWFLKFHIPSIILGLNFSHL